MQISLCDEMAKMFYNNPHYRWRVTEENKKYSSEYDFLVEILQLSSTNTPPPLTASQWMAIYDMCKLSR